MTTTAQRATPSTTALTPRRRRGLVLLLAGGIVALLLEPVGLHLYWLPLLSGLTYLAAACAGGRSGALWGPAAVVGVWGAAVPFWFRHWLGVQKLDFGGWSALALGVGILVALALSLAGIRLGLLSVGLPVLFVGLFVTLVDSRGGVFAQGGWYGLAYAIWGLWELRPAPPRPVAG